MRVRDRPTVEVEVQIAGDPSTIWALVTDISLPSRFSSELRGAEWVDGADGVAVGNRFRGRNENSIFGTWETECVVVEVEPGRRWVWDVLGPTGVAATWGFEVDPGRQTSTVRQWGRVGTGQSGLTPVIASMPDKEGRIISRRMGEWRSNMAANLEGIRRLVENPPPTEISTAESGQI